MQKSENKSIIEEMLKTINEENVFFYKDFCDAIYSKGIIITPYLNEN